MKKLLTLACLMLMCLLTAAAVAEQPAPSMTYTEPYLLSLHPDSEMNILWLTREPVQGYVEYGPTPALGNRVEAVSMNKGLHLRTAEGYDPDPARTPELPVYQLIAAEGWSMARWCTHRVTSRATRCSRASATKTAPESGSDSILRCSATCS